MVSLCVSIRIIGSTIGKKVCHFVMHFLNHRCPLDLVNDTFITLIPKVKNPFKVGEYRSIGLCNVIYKIIAKVFANRLEMILPNIISPN